VCVEICERHDEVRAGRVKLYHDIIIRNAVAVLDEIEPRDRQQKHTVVSLPVHTPTGQYYPVNIGDETSGDGQTYPPSN